MSEHLLTQGKKAWELYFEKDVLDPRLVRGAIASSWQRCRTLNVNPLLTSGSDVIEETQLLEQRRYEREQLIRVARPFLRDLSYFVGGSDFQVILTDENGLLLEVAGDERNAARAREVHLCAGANWSEASRGTNAIGTAIIDRAPVQIHAWEHFREENQFLTCSAAPIIDPAGNIAGVIDISGDCRYANPHTLGMVVAAVRAIENQLRLEQAMNKLSVASRYSNALVRGITDGLVAIDTEGIVTEINAKGGEIFGINPALAKGYPLKRLYKGDIPILQVVRNGKEYKNQEFIVNPSGRRIQSSASVLRDEDGSILGAVAFFSEIQTHQQAVRRGPVLFCHRYAFDDIVGDSLPMQKAKDWATLAATCTSTVLILGESGTGKEIFANSIHNASLRSRGPFLAINCAAMPESLIESELFGYNDGSFTGAKKGGQAGKFEMANGGTIFLDEIGEMSVCMQSKLLRVLQERTVSRIGSSQEINVDIRIIAATHCDLSKDVEEGRFREDLYYRLAVLEVKIPALRERMEDIPALAHCLIGKISTRLERPPVEMSLEFLQKLASYSWPGNVREMENVLERALIHTRGCSTLTVEHLELPTAKVSPVTDQESSPSRPALPHARTGGSLRDVEKQAIAEALDFCCGNIKQTAARLGIARNTLYRKMLEYGLVPEESR
jgi:transcriptional regulator of acetoin/glycerol metabolism